MTKEVPKKILEEHNKWLFCNDGRKADLSGADLSRAHLSGAKNLLSAVDYLEAYFERTEKGYIAYKTFGSIYEPPTDWNIAPGSVIDEIVNPNRQDECGCGINVALFEWVKKNTKVRFGRF